MALIGNCTNTVYTAHETETTSEIITLPNGDTETIETPVMIGESTNYDNIYMCVTQISNFNNWYGDQEGNPTKDIVVHFQYAAYESEVARDADKEDYLFWNQTQLDNPDLNSSLYTQMYNQLKAKEGFTNLIDG